MQSIFLCHSHEDRTFVNKLARDLALLGFRVWYDKWNLEVGDSIVDKVQEAIREAYCIVVIMSPGSVNSRWVRQELASAMSFELSNLGKAVLPVLYRDCEIPTFLHDKVYADFRESYNDGFRKLLRSLRSTANYPNPGLYYGALSAGDRERASNIIQKIRIEDLEGTWRGLTGRLEMHIDRDTSEISGQYDWQGYEYSGSLAVRKPITGVLRFDWRWSVTDEKGKGMFYYPFPDVLYGGWWWDSEHVSIQNLVEGDELPDNRWGFRRDKPHDNREGNRVAYQWPTVRE